MRTFLYIALTALFLASCESWHETAGDLAGMWQMTEWRDTEGQVVATKDDGLYYCVQLNLLKFQTGNMSRHYLSNFTHKGDSLLVGKTIVWPEEEVRPLTELAKYGVPADGHFHIDVLNSSHLVLSSGEQGVLTFRKY